MANNYLQFSESLPIQDDREEAWLRHQLADVLLTKSNTIFEEAEEDQIALEESFEVMPRFLAELPADVREDDSSLGFCWSIVSSPGAARGLWIYSEEAGNANHAALLIQKFLQHFDPAGWWTLTWGATCDQPRCGEFSGGAILVTASEIHGMDADRWIQEQANSLALTFEERR